MRVFLLPLLITLLSSLSAFAAKERAFIDEPEPVTPSSIQDRQPWEEIRASIPPWPKEADLVEFTLDAPSPFRYYIDGRHLSVGKDDVVRYTLVAESASGTRNVSFEGIRCKPNGLIRVYAYGSRGRFQPLKEIDWRHIDSRTGDQVHKELHGHFLCGPLTFEPRPKKDMIRALEGHIAERENSGFLPD